MKSTYLFICCEAFEYYLTLIKKHWIWNVLQRLTLEHLSFSWWYCMGRLWYLLEVQPVWMKRVTGESPWSFTAWSCSLFSLCFVNVYVVWTASLPFLPPDGPFPFPLPCPLNCDDSILRNFEPKETLLPSSCIKEGTKNNFCQGSFNYLFIILN